MNTNPATITLGRGRCPGGGAKSGHSSESFYSDATIICSYTHALAAAAAIDNHDTTDASTDHATTSLFLHLFLALRSNDTNTFVWTLITFISP